MVTEDACLVLRPYWKSLGEEALGIDLYFHRFLTLCSVNNSVPVVGQLDM